MKTTFIAFCLIITALAMPLQTYGIELPSHSHEQGIGLDDHHHSDGYMDSDCHSGHFWLTDSPLNACPDSLSGELIDSSSNSLNDYYLAVEPPPPK
ncbi:MAG: hypothetical protein K6L74_00630 [Neptuniibacter sp.]